MRNSFRGFFRVILLVSALIPRLADSAGVTINTHGFASDSS